MVTRWYRPAPALLPAVTLTLFFVALALATLWSPPPTPRAALAAPHPSAQCPALPPPTGRVVRVASEAELQAAVGALTSGTTVLVADGTYDLGNTLHLYGGLRDVTIRGESGERSAVVLRGQGMASANYGNVPHGILVSGAVNVTIADLTIRDVYYHAVQVQGEAGATGLTLYNVHLLDAGEQLVKGSTGDGRGLHADSGTVACSLLEYTDRARSDYTNGVDVLAAADWTIRDNTFRRIRAPAGQLAGPAVLMWRNSLDTIVERNLFIDCDRAIALGLAPPDPARQRDGETTYDHQGGVVRNNMIYRSAPAATGDVGITVNYARDFKLLHNTVIQNHTYPPAAIEYRFGASNGEIRFNLTDGPIQRRDGADAVLEGNLTNAPGTWFVAPRLGDLHLLPAALPALDAARTLAEVPDDFDGQPRPIASAPDIGADERPLDPTVVAAATDGHRHQHADGRADTPQPAPAIPAQSRAPAAIAPTGADLHHRAPRDVGKPGDKRKSAVQSTQSRSRHRVA